MIGGRNEQNSEVYLLRVGTPPRNHKVNPHALVKSNPALQWSAKRLAMT